MVGPNVMEILPQCHVLYATRRVAVQRDLSAWALGMNGGIVLSEAMMSRRLTASLDGATRGDGKVDWSRRRLLRWLTTYQSRRRIKVMNH